MSTNELFIALPGYGGLRDNTMAIARLLKSPPPAFRHLHLVELSLSLLTHNFNMLWATCLNHRPRMTHFLLWHSDILPSTENWLGVLMEEMERLDLQAISAVSPIKSLAGMTSTARSRGQFDARRYTMTEIHNGPETITSREVPDLLINTGLLLVDFRGDWVEKVHFQIHDRIVQEDGKWVAQTEPEDWNFSRQLASMGLPFAATRKVLLEHVGDYRYPSSNTWGFVTDDAYRISKKIEAIPARPADDYEYFTTIPGWFSEAEADVLKNLAVQATQPGGRIVEIGSWAGRTTWVLAHVADKVGASVLSIDPYPEMPTGYDYSLTGTPTEASTRFHALYDRYDVVTAQHVPSVEAAKAVPPGLDLVFIDGDHSYEAVSADINAWLPLVRDGGIICGDDYDHIVNPGVVKAVDALLPNRKFTGRVWYATVTKGT